ncbi:MAG: hypothetical protein A2365_03605 [Candidatus Nealsonbacteria bacterium RIFOXYB1_FULL_40_15]|uniref:Uncharacterized protein n=2 Tax=Candidatus Nealsoniibacteriota TaxID=1817911 RepID=A0A1G2ESY6_9BACT|nr:MAG: hypothetical protein A2365_03605 [Candidatus Nealsonbacteria bacterium RIFOXYB1_FULL_40_15]OGZ28388.1 MAG: hypothetical protein A2427_01290 [Candidatus Nealsonbacteria bacterium RIFOXYC1_FULL_40_7]OGZ29513.1 MAG: hypothetical protein A2562_02375 [Candidatus Nealsonbacteria bacterium RIFOXYD1_FULL_39_11]
MHINETPSINTQSETGCCPKFDPAPWDSQVFIFEEKIFLVGKTFNFFHIPLNMGRMMKKTWKKINDNQAVSNKFLVLSSDGFWRGIHYFALEKKIEGENIVEITGTFLSRVFEGDYKDMGKWVEEMKRYSELKGREMKNIYFFYTTCPKCAKHYGKNYVVAFAEV